jgi:hypothetical protein
VSAWADELKTATRLAHDLVHQIKVAARTAPTVADQMALELLIDQTLLALNLRREDVITRLAAMGGSDVR